LWLRDHLPPRSIVVMLRPTTSDDRRSDQRIWSGRWVDRWGRV